MKRILLFLAFLLTASPLLQAQGRSRNPQPRPSRERSHSSYHHHRSDRVFRTLEAVETTIEAAEAFYMLGSIADYRGLRMGVNMASLRTFGDIDGVHTDAKTGMNVGFVMGFEFGRSPFYFEPGIYYTGKGGIVGDYDYRTHAIELPMVVKYNIALDEEIYLQPFAGFFFAYGFAGKTENTVKHEDYDTFSDEGLKDFDCGLRTGFGLEIGRFYIEAAYDLGMACLPSPYYEDNGFTNRNSHIRSGCLSLGCGFNF